MRELALYAGAGGGLLASRWLLGHRIVGYVAAAAWRLLRAELERG